MIMMLTMFVMIVMIMITTMNVMTMMITMVTMVIMTTMTIVLIVQAKKGKYCCPVYVNQARWGEVRTIIALVNMVMISLHHPHPHKEWQLSN